jgi:hypothetical protein
MSQHYLPVPDDVAAILIEHGVRRIIVSLNGRVFRRALHNVKDIGPFIFISKTLLRDIGAGLGDMVSVELRADPDPDFVEICEELQVALEQDDEAGDRFYAMTPGRQRSLAHYANSAKRVETRIKRSLELAYKLRTYSLHGDKKKEV